MSLDEPPSRPDLPAGWLRRLLAERPRPRALAADPRAWRLVVATVCIGAFMGQLDASIVTVALPTLRRGFASSLGAVEWVALAYLLVLVATVTAAGRLADVWGRKLLYLGGFALFSLASLACGLAPSLGWLVAARVPQGVGAAMLQANSVALVAMAAPRDRLARALGAQGAAQAVGLALGPSVGGLLLAVAGWRWIFLVNVPAGALGLGLGWFLLPRSRNLAPRRPFDWPGLALFAPAACCLLLALARWPEPLALVLGAGLGAAFVARERRAGRPGQQPQAPPMLDLGLLARPGLPARLGAGLLAYLVLFGLLLAVPFRLEGGLGLGPGRAGLILGALPVGIALAAPVAGALADRLGARRPSVAGLAVAAAALAGLAADGAGSAGVAAALALAGLGLGAFTPANNAAVMAAAPADEAGLAGGLLNLTRGVGTAAGVALAGLVLTSSGGFGAVAAVLAGLAALAAALAWTGP